MIGSPGTFRDGVAIGLPLGDAPAFFCMGQLDHYINIWHWKADWQTDIDRRAARTSEKKEGGVRTFEVIPRRVSSVEDLIGGGFSTLTTKDKQGRVQGQAVWKDGVWHVVMRALVSKKENETLVPGIFRPCHSPWNGKTRAKRPEAKTWFHDIDPWPNSSRMLKRPPAPPVVRLLATYPRGYDSVPDSAALPGEARLGAPGGR